MCLFPHRKYCCQECWAMANPRLQRQPGTYVERICPSCGLPFRALAWAVARGHDRYCSQACFGRDRHKTVRHSRARGGKRPDLGNMYFRSRWEANWARYLEWMKGRGEILSWEYEPETFEFVGIKRGSRFYTPDFKVTNINNSVEYQEVKGWMDKRSATKLKRMKKYHPNIKIVLVEQPLYCSVKNNLQGIIPHWEAGR